jgi:hypothetical protein
LIFTCAHLPFEHPDFFPFLRFIKNKYKPDRVIILGDEADKHAMSFWTHDPDLHSAGDEQKITFEKLKKLYNIFPEADIMESNHGSMHLRRGRDSGIPRIYLRDISDVMRAPKGWKWHPDMTITLSNGQKLYTAHQIEKNVLLACQRRGMCVAQGHFHTSFEIRYSANPEKLIWGMSVGCLIDNKALAFAYNKTNKEKPIIGLGHIKTGIPALIPMILNKAGRWDKNA